MIPQETVNKILDTAQIVDVIGDFVTLKRRGANYIACCPFHNEKTPSFSVSPSKGIYKCFGCGKSGTAVGFIMEHESLSYVEALKYLAKKYHIEVVEKEETAEDIAKRDHKESLLLVSEFAGKHFQQNLSTAEGRAVGYAYFRSRGLEDETIKKYGLGWSMADRADLSSAARTAGYKEDFLIETGLSIRYDDGNLVDRFYDRAMFPIHSVSGRIIAFGGRTLRTDKKLAKYVNSPETEIYVKSRSLYGIYFAKNEIARKDKCILVEGYLDVLSMHQLGITNTVASSGTSLTVEQIRLIRKFTNNVTIIYDGDSAGIHAALRGIGLVLKEGMNVKIVLLPDGQDPDDFAKSHTFDQVNDYIAEHEQDFIAFKTDMLLGEAGDDPLKRANLINDIADTIALIPDAIVRSSYIRSSAQKFEIEEQLLLTRVSSTRNAALLAEQRRLEKEREAGGNIPSDTPVDAARDLSSSSFAASSGNASGVAYSNASGDGGNAEVVSGGYNGRIRLEQPELAPCEKELLGFVLEHGCDYLDFDRDSKYYVEGSSITVAEFIDSNLYEEDKAEFENLSYRKVYELYFKYYEEGLTQSQIQSRLLNSEDKEVVAVAEDILIEKYQLTVSNYEKSMTSASTKLVMFVPKTVRIYQCKRIELIVKELSKKLFDTQDSDSKDELVMLIDKYNKIRTSFYKELGRV